MAAKTDNEHSLPTAHRLGLEEIVWAAEKYRQAPDVEKAHMLEKWGSHIAFNLKVENTVTEFSLHASSRVTAEQIGSAIAAFFEAAQTCLLELPWPHTPQGKPDNPALTALVSIIDAWEASAMAAKGAGTMDYVFNTLKWNPDGLWVALFATQEMVKRQLELEDKSWQVQPFWRWTAQLGVQACLTEWQPNNNSLSDKMWYVTPFHEMDNADVAVQQMATKAPWSFGAALEYYQDEPEEHVSTDMAQTIFQMDYAQANIALSTQLLLSLMFEYSRYHAYSAGLQILQDKHPDLFAAFKLQVSLHDGPQDAEKYASACESAWMHAVHGKPVDCMALPDLGLESP